jgi:hypothetical protein
MVRCGRIARAPALFPWLVAGELARIFGFLQARRQFKRTGIFERAREMEARA